MNVKLLVSLSLWALALTGMAQEKVSTPWNTGI